MTAIDTEITRLRRTRPRSRFLRSSLALFGLFCAYAWLGGDIAITEFDFARRSANAARFLDAILPYPLQKLGHWDWAVAYEWATALLDRGGWHALGTTLAISVAAIVLAGAVGSIAAVAAARNLVRPDSFADSPAAPSALAGALATTWVAVVRGMLIFVRAIPEYVWAFLLIKIFGFTAWPAVLALAIHNVGILGKLGGETIEDIEPQQAEAFAALGASRGQILLGAAMPEVLPKFLLYFFYRWETCVREATVLGMLGIVSLGSLVRDARAANFYDEMLFYVLLASGLVLVGDVVSASVRATLRRAA
jgi:phosphonate transport system permease protein